MWPNNKIHHQWRNYFSNINHYFLIWNRPEKVLSNKENIEKISRSFSTFQRLLLFLTLMKLSSFVKESEESFPANRILKYLMFESLRCSVDFLKRQYRVFVTQLTEYFDVLFLLKELANFWKWTFRCNIAIKVCKNTICYLKA